MTPHFPHSPLFIFSLSFYFLSFSLSLSEIIRYKKKKVEIGPPRLRIVTWATCQRYGGDQSSWGVLGRVLKWLDFTLLCHRLPHSLRSLTPNCRHHSLIHNSTQAAVRHLFQIGSLRHLAFHSNWFGNLLWFLFIFFFPFW